MKASKSPLMWEATLSLLLSLVQVIIKSNKWKTLREKSICEDVKSGKDTPHRLPGTYKPDEVSGNGSN